MPCKFIAIAAKHIQKYAPEHIRQQPQCSCRNLVIYIYIYNIYIYIYIYTVPLSVKKNYGLRNERSFGIKIKKHGKVKKTGRIEKLTTHKSEKQKNKKTTNLKSIKVPKAVCEQTKIKNRIK